MTRNMISLNVYIKQYVGLHFLEVSTTPHINDIPMVLYLRDTVCRKQ